MESLYQKARTSVRDVVLVGLAALSLGGCALGNTQSKNNYAEIRKDSVNCTIVSIEGEPNVLYVEEVPPIEVDKDTKTYHDIGVDGRLDLVLGGFVKDDQGDSGEVLSQKIRESLEKTGRYEGKLMRVPEDYQIVDDLNTDPIQSSSFYYDPDAKRIQRSTDKARELQREFEDLKGRCKATERIEIR